MRSRFRDFPWGRCDCNDPGTECHKTQQGRIVTTTSNAWRTMPALLVDILKTPLFKARPKGYFGHGVFPV